MNEITKFFDEVNKLSRSQKHATKLFADRAIQLIANSFQKNIQGDFVLRENADTTKVEIVNKLVAMGATEAVYGHGRIYLH